MYILVLGFPISKKGIMIAPAPRLGRGAKLRGHGLADMKRTEGVPGM